LFLLLLFTPISSRAEEQDNSGRPEALLFAGAFGFYQGIAISVLLAEEDLLDSEFFALALTLTTTAANVAAVGYVSEEYGINDADAALFNSSLFWVLLSGSALGVHRERYGVDMILDTLISGYLGQLMGIYLATNVDRTAGQVSLTNTVGTWTGAEASLMMGIFGVDKASPYFTLGTLSANLGLLGGVWLSDRYPISRERARMLDLGALMGGLAGPAALFMLWDPDDNEQEWYLSSVALGIPAGIAFMWHLTRDWGVAEVKPSVETLMLPLVMGVW